MADQTVSLTLIVKVISEGNVVEGQRIIKISNTQVQGTQHMPQTIPANSINLQLNLGGVTSAKWLLLEFDQPTTVKIGASSDVGVEVSNVLLVESVNGNPTVFVTTGVNPTKVRLLVAGS